VIRDEANTKSFACSILHPFVIIRGIPPSQFLEFIEYEDWYFVVMPFCNGCHEVPFRNAAEVLDFAEQFLAVSSRVF
jgi:hypothetical protein